MILHWLYEVVKDVQCKLIQTLGRFLAGNQFYNQHIDAFLNSSPLLSWPIPRYFELERRYETSSSFIYNLNNVKFTL